jgi:dihydrofolate reductase
MRKLMVLAHMTLDGVIQAPSGSEEDVSGGFGHGGWTAGYADEVLSTAVRRQMNSSFDLLLGRKTFDIWAPYWPQHDHIWPQVNRATKYIASNSLTSHSWQPTHFLSGDIAPQIAQLKQQTAPDLHVWGSATLLQTLLRHDLVDSFWLMIYPLTLGVGKRLFAEGTIPAKFQVRESVVTSKGVMLVTYDRI